MFYRKEFEQEINRLEGRINQLEKLLWIQQNPSKFEVGERVIEGLVIDVVTEENFGFGYRYKVFNSKVKQPISLYHEFELTKIEND